MRKIPTIIHHQIAVVGMFVCAILLQGSAHAEPDDQALVTPDNARLRETIKQEAARQDRVSADIEELNRELNVFIEDAKTNQIYKDAQGEIATTTVTKLGDTNDEFVRNAAGSLRIAAGETAGRQDQLASASGDIKSAIDVLTELMKLTDSYRGQEQLHAEVGQIIRSLEEAIGKSANMEQIMSQGKQPEARQFDALAAEQEKIAERIASLREMLQQAENYAITDTEKNDLALVADAMSGNTADSSMRNAGQNIREGEMAAALAHQNQALEEMQKLAEVLNRFEEARLAEGSNAQSQPGEGQGSEATGGEGGEGGEAPGGEAAEGEAAGGEGSGGKAAGGITTGSEGTGSETDGGEPAQGAGGEGGVSESQGQGQGEGGGNTADLSGSRVSGHARDGGSSTWRSLNDEDRAGLGENFARELPLEYRDMLKAYYEQLAK